MGGRLRLLSTQGEEGRRLWRTDGTPAGTIRLSDLALLDRAGIGYDGAELTPLGDRLFFIARDPEHGQEVWATDGSPAGTARVTDIAAGPADSKPAALTVVGDRLFFLANAGRGGVMGQSPIGKELWGTDGTPRGTTRVGDPFPGPIAPDFADLTADADTLYFTARGVGIWREVFKFPPGEPAAIRVSFSPDNALMQHPAHLRVIGGRVFYDARELWTADGTPAGTLPLSALTGGVPVRATYTASAVFENRLLVGSKSDNVTELWSTDGTAAGTYRLPVWLPSSIASFEIKKANGPEPIPHTVCDGVFYFAAYHPTAGLEPCRTDGTPAGTRPVADLAASSATQFEGDWHSAGGIGYFHATTPLLGDPPLPDNPQRLRRLWQTDGTAHGTIPVPKFSYNLVGHVVHDQHLYVVTGNSHDTRLYRVEGDELTPVADLPSVTGTTEEATWGAAAGDRIYFVLGGYTDRTFVQNLWSSDLTAAGTQVVFTTPSKTRVTLSEPYAAIGSILYFTAADAGDDVELWRTDGTPEGTRRVADILPGPRGSKPAVLFACGPLLYFLATDEQGRGALYRTDGTEAGTQPIRDGETSQPVRPVTLETLGDTLYFIFRTRTGWALGRTDGTTEGTSRVTLPEDVAVDSPQMQVCGDRIYWTGRSGSGVELWQIDGTAAGTRQVADIRPGADSSRPSHFQAVGRTLYFFADDGTAGRELWRTDGTADGTVRVTDIAPGPASSAARLLGMAGNRLYLVADDGIHGNELWALDLPLDTAPAQRLAEPGVSD